MVLRFARKRRFRHLGLLVIAVLGIVLTVGLLIWWMHPRYEEELAAVAEFDPYVTTRRGVPVEIYFHEPLANIALEDRHMATLARIASLELVSIRHAPRLTDEGIGLLASLRELRALSLNYVPATDASLATLSSLQKLVTLVLEGTEVSDQGLERLHSYQSLTNVDLCWTQVTPEGIMAFEPPPTVKVVFLGTSAQGFTDEVLDYLSTRWPAVTFVGQQVFDPDDPARPAPLRKEPERIELMVIDEPGYWVEFQAVVWDTGQLGLEPRDVQACSHILLESAIHSMKPQAREFFLPYLSRHSNKTAEGCSRTIDALLKDGVAVDVQFGHHGGGATYVVSIKVQESKQ